MLTRILKGDPRYKTRLHDFEGNRASIREMLRLPRSLASAFLSKLGYRVRLPWMNYPAIKRLAEVLTPDSKVLEFGSGSSTLWLARRCGCLVTLENDSQWFKYVKASLRTANVDARLGIGPTDYLRVEGYPDRYFDLVIVDGRWRDASMVKALRAVKAGGYVYLDNSDVQDSEHQEAKRLLLAACPSAERLIGLTPLRVTTTQGLLGRYRSSSLEVQ